MSSYPRQTKSARTIKSTGNRSRPQTFCRYSKKFGPGGYSARKTPSPDKGVFCPCTRPRIAHEGGSLAGNKGRTYHSVVSSVLTGCLTSRAHTTATLRVTNSGSHPIDLGSGFSGFRALSQDAAQDWQGSFILFLAGFLFLF